MTNTTDETFQALNRLEHLIVERFVSQPVWSINDLTAMVRQKTELIINEVTAKRMDALPKNYNFGTSRPRSKETHCINGHEYTPENTGIGHDGHRKCLTCYKARLGPHSKRNKKKS